MNWLLGINWWLCVIVALHARIAALWWLCVAGLLLLWRLLLLSSQLLLDDRQTLAHGRSASRCEAV